MFTLNLAILHSNEQHAGKNTGNVGNISDVALMKAFGWSNVLRESGRWAKGCEADNQAPSIVKVRGLPP